MITCIVSFTVKHHHTHLYQNRQTLEIKESGFSVLLTSSHAFEKPRGSKPTSPAIDPSNAGGFSRKGTEGDFACRGVELFAPIFVPILVKALATQSSVIARTRRYIVSGREEFGRN